MEEQLTELREILSVRKEKFTELKENLLKRKNLLN